MFETIKEKISKNEYRIFTVWLLISMIFFFQEYFYIIIPNHKPLWIPGSFYSEPIPIGIPLTIIGIMGLGFYVIWYIQRGRWLEED